MPKVNYLNSVDKSNVCLVVCCYISVEKVLEEGFAGIDNAEAMENLREASKLLNKAYDRLISGCSAVQMREIERFAGCHEMVIVPKSSCINATRQEDSFVVDKRDVMEVCKHAKDYECFFCDKESGCAKNCRLKWALDRIGVEPTGNDRACHFRNKEDF